MGRCAGAGECHAGDRVAVDESADVVNSVPAKVVVLPYVLLVLLAVMVSEAGLTVRLPSV